MKTADLVLVHGTDWVGWGIEEISRSPYSHIAGFTSEDHLVEAQAFRKTGYVCPSTYVGCDVYTCDTATDEQREGIRKFVESKIGTHYSYPLIAWELIRYLAHLDLPFEERERFICSTLWVMAYRSVGIDLCPGIKYPSPGDIAVSQLLRKRAS